MIEADWQRPFLGRRSRHLGSCLLMALATALIYGRVIGFDYVYLDDTEYLFAPMVRDGLSLAGLHWAFTETHMSNWHPLTWVSHMIDVSLFGTAPGPQHLVNAVLHLVNGLLLYALFLRLLGKAWVALVLALLFLVHPLHVESVAWIAERKDVLCGLFYLWAIVAYISYTKEPGIRRYLHVMLPTALALMSKPMAVSLPIVFLLLDFWPLCRQRSSWNITGKPYLTRIPERYLLVLEKSPLLVLSLATGIITIAAQQNTLATVQNVAIEYRVMNAAVAYVTYLRDTIVPLGLAAFYPLEELSVWTVFLPALALLIAISVLTILGRSRYPWLATGWLWFLLTLLPVIGLLQVGSQSHADRYMYLPSIGLLLALGGCLSRLEATARRQVALIVVPLLVFYSGLAWIQVAYWKNPVTLYSRTLHVVGDNYPAHINLAAYYIGQGNFELAETHGRKAVELEPRYPAPYRVLGDLLLQRGDAPGAERLFRVALTVSPQDNRSLRALALSLERQGRDEEAQKIRRRAHQEVVSPRAVDNE